MDILITILSLFASIIILGIYTYVIKQKLAFLEVNYYVLKETILEAKIDHLQLAQLVLYNEENKESDKS